MKISKETKIGVFAVLALGLLYWGVNFIKGTGLFRGNNTYYAVYDQVSGLKVASPVKFKGLNIGVINSMKYDSNLEKVILELSVKSKYEIPKDSKAKVFSDGLMGGKALELVLGKDSECYISGDTLISSIDQDFMSMAGSEFEALKNMATDMIGQVTTALQGINTIMDNNSTSLNTTMNNLASISGSMKDVFGSESENIKQIIQDLNKLSSTLSANSGKMENIVGNIEGFTDSLSRAELPTMVENLNTTLSGLNTTLDGINKGEGTMGRLMSDEALYDSLTVATSNLAVLLEDLKANPGRYVQFSVFGKKNK